MSLQRAVGFLHTRIRLSPRVIPRTAPARSIYTLRDLPVGEGGIRGAYGVAAAAIAGVAALAAEYFRKAPVDDESARKKEEDLKVMFEDWMKEYNRTYRDEEEKAVRFQVFKDKVKWIESLPPSSQKILLPPNCFADLRDDELPCSQSCIDVDFDDPDKYTIDYKNGKTKIWK